MNIAKYVRSITKVQNLTHKLKKLFLLVDNIHPLPICDSTFKWVHIVDCLCVGIDNCQGPVVPIYGNMNFSKNSTFKWQEILSDLIAIFQPSYLEFGSYIP